MGLIFLGGGSWKCAVKTVHQLLEVGGVAFLAFFAQNVRSSQNLETRPKQQPLIPPPPTMGLREKRRVMCLCLCRQRERERE